MRTNSTSGVRALGRRTAQALRAAAERDGQRWLHADCSAATDKAGVLAAIARGFGFPRHFGMNLDALFDCLGELTPLAGAEHPGLVLLIENLPAGGAFDDTERRRLLATFRDAADDFAARAVAFRAFYTLRRPTGD